MNWKQVDSVFHDILQNRKYRQTVDTNYRSEVADQPVPYCYQNKSLLEYCTERNDH